MKEFRLPPSARRLGAAQLSAVPAPVLQLMLGDGAQVVLEGPSTCWPSACSTKASTSVIQDLAAPSRCHHPSTPLRHGSGHQRARIAGVNSGSPEASETGSAASLQASGPCKAHVQAHGHGEPRGPTRPSPRTRSEPSRPVPIPAPSNRPPAREGKTLQPSGTADPAPFWLSARTSDPAPIMLRQRSAPLGPRPGPLSCCEASFGAAHQALLRARLAVCAGPAELPSKRRWALGRKQG